MRFKDVFSIIGPDMIGPSSSHTAGAVRIGRAARQLFGVQPERAVISLYRSFADTYRGHGTDIALAAGLLDWDTNDPRIPDALQHAEQAGMEIVFQTVQGTAVSHPNTAEIEMTAGGRSKTVTGVSIGGGNIEITAVDDFNVRCSGMYPTVAILHRDRVGMLAEITGLFSKHSLNIGSLNVDRKGRSGEAMTLIEADGKLEPRLLSELYELSGISEIRAVDLS
jgi:L-serine dehydratase